MLEAIILAGGMGTRLQAVLVDCPKPMAPISGRPFLEYQLEFLVQNRVEHVVLALSYRAKDIQGHFGKRFLGVDINYSVEETPKGTGGALIQAIPELKSREAFLVANGDTLFRLNVSALLAFHKKMNSDFTLALSQVTVNRRFSGVILDSDGRVVQLEARESSQNRLVNGGMYVVSRSFFDQLSWSGTPCSLEDELLPTWLKDNRKIFGFHSDGPFIDIGMPDDYEKAALTLGRT